MECILSTETELYIQTPVEWLNIQNGQTIIKQV